MNIHCLECEKEFIPSELNTAIIGPYVKVTCPYCSYIYEDKLLNFVEAQIGGFERMSALDANKMIEIAEFVELNSSDYYRKRGLRHGGKKKVRDIRD
jgi:DNA-directed RNA polymerase subunit RPC12/RpoP